MGRYCDSDMSQNFSLSSHFRISSSMKNNSIIADDMIFVPRDKDEKHVRLRPENLVFLNRSFAVAPQCFTCGTLSHVIS